MARSGVLAVIVLLLAACGDPSPFASAVFSGAGHETGDCETGGACVRVFSEVDGTSDGTGRCILYAVTSEGQVAVAASGMLELQPGEIVEWTARVPPHLGSLGWNPVCEPTAEG